MALNPDGTGSSTTPGYPLDSYTPSNYAQLQNTDADLGSTAPAILPSSAVPASSLYKHLAVQGGKDGYLRVLNMDDLSGHGGPGHVGGELSSILVPGGGPDIGEIVVAPAIWVNPADNSIWVYVIASYLVAFKLTVNSNGVPGLQEMWSNSNISGTSPLVANGVLFLYAGSSAQAFNPVTGSSLWSSGVTAWYHWESPVIANGMLYLADNNGLLTAYGLPSSTGGSQMAMSTVAGWNLVGGSPLTLWSDSSVNWSFDALSGQWYHPTGAESPGTGTWEYVPTSGNRTVNVQVCSNTLSISVVAHRWNLVGNPCNVPVSLPNSTQALWWDPNARQYVPLTSIQAGSAAWVKPAASPLSLTPGFRTALLSLREPESVRDPIRRTLDLSLCCSHLPGK